MIYSQMKRYKYGLEKKKVKEETFAKWQQTYKNEEETDGKAYKRS